MPSPTKDTIKLNRVNALKAVLNPDGSQRYTKKTIDPDTGVVTSTNELPDELLNLLDALSTGDHQTWLDWQASQVVSPTSLTPMSVVTAPGAVIGTGTLP